LKTRKHRYILACLQINLNAMPSKTPILATFPLLILLLLLMSLSLFHALSRPTSCVDHVDCFSLRPLSFCRGDFTPLNGWL
jgi:hypothetical protein